MIDDQCGHGHGDNKVENGNLYKSIFTLKFEIHLHR